MSPTNNKFDLIAFDVDGTLVLESRGWTVWEVLNKRFTGSSEHNKDRYKRYLAGELSYAEWVELDVTGWRDAGATRDQILEAFSPLRLIDGARETLDALKQTGVHLVVISGTLDVMLNALFPDHPFDEVHANHLAFSDDGTISHWTATPFDMAGKAKALRGIAMREGYALSRCAYIGDSSNDVWIARDAGFTVALNPRSEELESLADAVVRTADLRDILPHLLPKTA